MKRRDFIKLSSAAGVAGVVGPHFDAAANPLYAQQASGFDLHPFIKAHPEAVFVYLTDVKEKTDQKGTHDAAYKLASEMFVSTSGGAGFPNSTKIAAKPNWTCAPQSDGHEAAMGIVTDLGFIEGYLKAVKAKGPQEFHLRECACTNQWEPLGFTAMADRNNFNLSNEQQDPWVNENGAVILKEVKNGTITRVHGFQAPMNGPDTFLINLAKFKSHYIAGGVTGCIKNLQGTSARRFNSFCGMSDLHRSLPEGYHPYFIEGHLDRVRALFQRHLEEGYPRWEAKMARAPFDAGFYIEQWCQRMCDAYSTFDIGTNDIHVLEGIYWRDGDGFLLGPHNGKAQDIMCNMTLFGRDPFRIDIVAHWLSGHEPGNLGLFHIGMERGVSDVLDPFDIPVYTWNNGRARSTRLNRLKRTPLRTSYNPLPGMDLYNLLDEPFDYKAWKATGKIAKIEPSIRAIGTDSNNNIVMDLNVPTHGGAYVDIKNSQGEVVWSMIAPDLEPGSHQVVWDGFRQPGMHNAYVKGMSWDAEAEMVIYT